MKPIKISSKNQIVVPKSARKKLGLCSGDNLVIAKVTDEYLVLRKQPSYFDFIGTAPRQGKDPVERIRSVRDDWR